MAQHIRTHPFINNRSLLTYPKEDKLGLNIHPSHVRLKSNNDSMEYTWKILDQDLVPLFQQHLSKHSVSAYKRLYSEIGKTFHVTGKVSYLLGGAKIDCFLMVM